MEFMKSYKYLDNLCRDMNGIGITGYIKDMEQESLGKVYVNGWDTDYSQLKHYRWVRNQIVHENYSDESDMSSPEDTAWLDEFYQRIMKQTDPLAMCYKKTKFHFTEKTIKAKTPSVTQSVPSHSELNQTARKPIRRLVLLLTAVVAILILFFFFGL